MKPKINLPTTFIFIGLLLLISQQCTAEDGVKFSKDYFSQNIPQWQKYKSRFENKPNMRGLEIGSFEGRSTLWLTQNYFNGSNSTLEAIDTWKGSVEHRGFNNLDQLYDTFLSNLKKYIKSGHVIPVKGRSKDILLRFNLEVLEGKRKRYNFIYVDGAHDAVSVAEDAVLAWSLLEVGGILIFDDYLWPLSSYADLLKVDAILMVNRYSWRFSNYPSHSVPKPAIDFFLYAYAGQYKILHQDYQVHIEKL